MKRILTNKRKWWPVVCFGLVFLCGIPQPSTAGTETIEAEYTWVADLVNDMRNNPFSHGLRVGYAADSLENLPWMAAFTADEKVSVSIDDFFSRRAMALNSADPLLTVEQEILTENDYARTGEAGGVLSFYNFMDLDSAVSIVIDNLLKQELSPGYNGERYLLSSDFDRMGIAVRSGMVQSASGNKNAYYITLCFGSSLSVYQVQLLNMINIARMQPSSMSSHMLFNLMEVINAHPASLQVFSQPLPPLFMDRGFQRTAATFLEHSENVNVRQSYPEDDSSETHLISAVDTFPLSDTSSTVARAFSVLIKNELIRFPDHKGVFDSAATHAGGDLNIIGGVSEDLIKVALVTGKPIVADMSNLQIYGLVYRDSDGNQTYTPGEGVPCQKVLYGESEDTENYNIVFADNAGHFYISFETPGKYFFRIDSGDDVMQKEIYLDGKQCLEMVLPKKDN